MDSTTCVRCGGSMEPGFVVDHAYGAIARSEWALGEQRYSKWSGMQMKGRQLYKEGRFHPYEFLPFSPTLVNT
jgi:hypothetical protein